MSGDRDRVIDKGKAIRDKKEKVSITSISDLISRLIILLVELVNFI